MNRHVGTVSILWIVAGLWLIAVSVHGLVTESWVESVVTSWLVSIAFGAFAILAAVAFWRRGLVGRVLIWIASVLTLLYAAAWLLMGGVEDAGGYWPWMLFLTALAIYGIWVARRVAREVVVAASATTEFS